MKKLRETTPRSDCNRALTAAGMPLLPPLTGVRYSVRELLSIARDLDTGQTYDMWLERRLRSTGAVSAARSAVQRRRETAAD